MPTRDWTWLLWLVQHLSESKVFGFWGEYGTQGWNLKELTEGHHQEWSLRLNLTQHGETHQVQTYEGLTDWKLFQDYMGGGAWPFLVRGVICLVNSDNERDLNLLNRQTNFLVGLCIFGYYWLLRETTEFNSEEVWGNNRSVMPLDVLGRTRATLMKAASL